VRQRNRDQLRHNQAKKKKIKKDADRRILVGLMARRRACDTIRIMPGPWPHDIAVAHSTVRRACVQLQVNLRCHPTLLALRISSSFPCHSGIMGRVKRPFDRVCRRDLPPDGKLLRANIHSLIPMNSTCSCLLCLAIKLNDIINRVLLYSELLNCAGNTAQGFNQKIQIGSHACMIPNCAPKFLHTDRQVRLAAFSCR